MKKILLSTFVYVSIISASFGQSFTTDHGDTAISSFPLGGQDLKVHNYITNTTTADMNNLQWKLLQMSSVPTGFTFVGICDNITCHSPASITGGQTKTYGTITPGQKVDFSLAVNIDASTAATGSFVWVKSELKNLDDNQTEEITLIAYKNGPTSVNTIKSEDEVTLFPNPARNAINVVYNASLGVKNIGVYNLIGKMVSVYKVGNTSAKLDIDELPAGIYFVRLFDVQGRTVATRKFTHQ